MRWCLWLNGPANECVCVNSLVQWNVDGWCQWLFLLKPREWVVIGMDFRIGFRSPFLGISLLSDVVRERPRYLYLTTCVWFLLLSLVSTIIHTSVTHSFLLLFLVFSVPISISSLATRRDTSHHGPVLAVLGMHGYPSHACIVPFLFTIWFVVTTTRSRLSRNNKNNESRSKINNINTHPPSTTRTTTTNNCEVVSSPPP